MSSLIPEKEADSTSNNDQDMEALDPEKSASAATPNSGMSDVSDDASEEIPTANAEGSYAADAEGHMQQANSLIYGLRSRNLELQQAGYKVDSPLLDVNNPVVQAAVRQEEPAPPPPSRSSDSQAMDDFEPL